MKLSNELHPLQTWFHSIEILLANQKTWNSFDVFLLNQRNFICTNQCIIISGEKHIYFGIININFGHFFTIYGPVLWNISCYRWNRGEIKHTQLSFGLTIIFIISYTRTCGNNHYQINICNYCFYFETIKVWLWRKSWLSEDTIN